MTDVIWNMLAAIQFTALMWVVYETALWLARKGEIIDLLENIKLPILIIIFATMTLLFF